MLFKNVGEYQDIQYRNVISRYYTVSPEEIPDTYNAFLDEVRKAGYQVDDYDLKIMDRIPKLETKGKVKVIILSPDSDGKLYTYLDERSKFIVFDGNMNIVDSVIKQDKDKPRRELTEEEKPKYEKEVKEEINKLLDDVYKAGQE